MHEPNITYDWTTDPPPKDGAPVEVQFAEAERSTLRWNAAANRWLDQQRVRARRRLASGLVAAHLTIRVALETAGVEFIADIR